MMLLLLYNRGMPEANICLALEKKDYPCIKAENFESGYDILADHRNDIHVIVVNYSLISADKNFLQKLAGDEKFSDIPLILAVDETELKNIKPFRHTAPTYWLQSPFTDHSLLSMIAGADGEFSRRRQLRQEIRRCQTVFGSLMRGTFRLKTFEQAESLTAMLSRTCPEPDRVALGLFELLANGIEHGNLDISHEEKWTLMENNRYGQEISRRLALPAYRDRYVELTVEREKNLIFFRIEDQGAGFNYHDYLTCDLSVNERCHGRGIALARDSSFDYLEYLGTGNRVLAITRFTG